MLKDILQIENIISGLERNLPNLSEDSAFEKLFELRQLAFSDWIEEDPDSLDADSTTEVRDRITNIEQRLLNLAAAVPATSIPNIQLKLKLWVLFKDLLEPGAPRGDIADDLIVSVFQDLTRAQKGASVARIQLKTVC